jgi:hypothetical protein
MQLKNFIMLDLQAIEGILLLTCKAKPRLLPLHFDPPVPGFGERSPLWVSFGDWRAGNPARLCFKSDFLLR